MPCRPRTQTLPGVDPAPESNPMQNSSRPPALPIFLLLAAALGAPTLAAQEAADSWRTQLELGFNGATGNSSFSVLRTGGSLRYLHAEVAEFEFSALRRFGKSDGKIISNDMRATLKLDWNPRSSFSPLVFITASRDQIRKLDARINGGVGAQWTFLRRDQSKISLSTGALLDYENYQLVAGSTDTESETTFRVSARIEVDHQFGSGTTFRHVTSWQPEAANFGDYNIEMTNSLSTRILSNLALALEHEYAHDEVPPPGVKKDDQKFSAVLRVTL